MCWIRRNPRRHRTGGGIAPIGGSFWPSTAGPCVRLRTLPTWKITPVQMVIYIESVSADRSCTGRKLTSSQRQDSCIRLMCRAFRSAIWRCSRRRHSHSGCRFSAPEILSPLQVTSGPRRYDCGAISFQPPAIGRARADAMRARWKSEPLPIAGPCADLLPELFIHSPSAAKRSMPQSAILANCVFSRGHRGLGARQRY